MTTGTVFAVGESVLMLVNKTKKIGFIEEICGDFLFVRWVISGTRKIRSWGWISSRWALKRHPLIVQTDELSIKWRL
jgi:hypothetical protein